MKTSLRTLLVAMVAALVVIVAAPTCLASDGTFITSWKTWGPPPGTPFASVSAVSVDGAGKVYVYTDSVGGGGGSSTVYKYANDGTYESAFGNDVLTGMATGYSMDVDAAGRAYVLNEQFIGIATFDSSGAYVGEIGADTLMNLWANLITVSSDGTRIYCAGLMDPGKIWVLDQSGNLVDTWDTGMELVTGLGTDAAGNVYVAGPLTNIYKATYHAMKYDSAGTLLWTVGTGYGSGTTPLQFKTIADIAGDATGVYVADDGNSRVVKLAAADGAFISTWGSYAVPPGPSQFSYGPWSLALDAASDLFAVDYGSSRVQKFGSAVTEPAITGFSPTSGPAKTSVTVSGLNLSDATAVTFNGVPASTFSVDSATQITAKVPAGATTGKIVVTTPSGTATSTGTFTRTATTWYVPTDCGTIQAAVDTATAGDTIQVAAGTYSAAVAIDKALTLRGAQAGVDPSASGRPGGESVIVGGYPIAVRASDVTLDGFEITGWDQAVNAEADIDDLTVSHNWIHAPNGEGRYGVLLGVAGHFATPPTVSNITVTNNIIDSAAAGGVALGGGHYDAEDGIDSNYANVVISNNDIGNGDGDAFFDGSDPNDFTIDGMTITGNYLHNPGGNGNVGNIADGVLSNNVIAGGRCVLGIDTGSVTGNTFQDGGRLGLWGIDSQNGPTPQAAFVRPSKDVTVANNDFKDQVNGRSMNLWTDDPYTDTIAVNANAFRNSGLAPLVSPPVLSTEYPFILTSGFGNLIADTSNVDRTTGAIIRSQALDATGNWWGAASGPTGNAGGSYGTMTTSPFITGYANDPTKQVAPTSWPQSTLSMTALPGFSPIPTTPPTITSFTPADGSDGTTVTITGTAFTDATSVTFNGTASTSFVVDSATQISAAAPSGVTTGKIAVTTADGTGESATDWTADFIWSDNGDGTCDITGYAGPGGAVVIPSKLGGNDVVHILDMAFLNSTTIMSVSVPSGVTYVGESAFEGCTGMTSATLPDSVTDLGPAAFRGCTSLTSMTLPSGLTSIADDTLSGCSSLVTVSIPTGVASVGQEAFRGCTSLASITLPAGLTSIGDGAFQGCSVLTTIDLPSGLTHLGESAFGYCTVLDGITIPAGITSIGTQTFNECRALSSILIPSGVTDIGMQAFMNCTSLSTVTIPNAVANIHAMAFAGCTKLTTARFLGNAPVMGDAFPPIPIFGPNYVFANTAPTFTVRYYQGATGFGPAPPGPWWVYRTAYMPNLTGLVTGSGSPRSGIYCYAYQLVGSSWVQKGFTTTNASGVYSLNLAAGTYRVYFSDTSRWFQPEYYDGKATIAAADDVVVIAGQVTNAGADLAPLGRINGTVTGAGSVRSGVIVYAYQLVGSTWTQKASASTAANGSYTLYLAPGTYRVYYSDPSRTFISEYYDDKATIATGDDVTVNALDTATANADLAAQGRIAGTVTGSGSPRSGVIVYAYQLVGGSWIQKASAATAADGTFILYLLPGTYRVYYSDPSRAFIAEYYDDKATITAADDVGVSALGTTTANADLAPTPPPPAPTTLRGTVTGAGAARANITVTAYKFASGAWAAVASKVTTASGGYAFTLAADTYRLYFNDPSGAWVAEYYNNKASLAAADDIPLASGTTVVADAELVAATSPSYIRGTVTGSGVAQSGVYCYAYQLVGSSWAQKGFATTNASGGYSIKLISGTYRVYFADTTHWYQPEYYNDKASIAVADDISVSPGVVSTADADLAPQGRIVGTVMGSDSPRPSVLVCAYQFVGSSWVQKASVSTAANGTYALYLLPGTYRVSFSDTTRWYQPEYYNGKATLAAADDVTVSALGVTMANADLTAQGRIVGTVTGSGSARSGVSVYAYQLVGSTWTQKAMANTAADGTFTLYLPTGVYRVYYSDPSKVFLPEYYNNKATLAAADDVTVSALGATTASAELTPK